MSTGVAHADPRFAVVESQARAGEAVHFSIADVESRTKYGLEIGDLVVLEGTAATTAVSGQFTMPDLGAVGKAVTVEARIREPDGGTTTVRRSLQYLPPAPPPAPAEAPPAPAPTAAAPAQPASAPAHSLGTRTEPAAPQRTEERGTEHQGESANPSHENRETASEGKKRRRDKKDKDKDKDKDKTRTRTKEEEEGQGQRQRQGQRQGRTKTRKSKDKKDAAAGKAGGGFPPLNAIFPSTPSSAAGENGGISSAAHARAVRPGGTAARGHGPCPQAQAECGARHGRR